VGPGFRSVPMSPAGGPGCLQDCFSKVKRFFRNRFPPPCHFRFDPVVDKGWSRAPSSVQLAVDNNPSVAVKGLGRQAHCAS
jgi:hypothetical protein